MKINATDPDLSTIYGRIKSGFMDLQPDFQRGEVWTTAKKRMLIDTILRGWQIPPIHVILDEVKYTHEVLDGQQRLCAIRDFMNNKIKVNGELMPLNEELKILHGLTYSKLPHKVKMKFDMYPVRIFEIYEYEKGEPGELFNRLNQALSLTAAEKRNAYVGGVRQQIKDLVEKLDENDIGRDFLGFSNLRQAYEDLFLKLCYLVENNDITANPSDKELENIYRQDSEFSIETINAVSYSITVFSEIKEKINSLGYIVHITKASFFSWLFFISKFFVNYENDEVSNVDFVNSYLDFEVNRYKYRSNEVMDEKLYIHGLNESEIKKVYSIFNERASSRVMTSESLLIRDACISLAFFGHNGIVGENETKIKELFEQIKNNEDIYQAFDSYFNILGVLERA